jgi:hypothetical protein
MAKVAFGKLKCKINEDIKTIDFAGEKIEVKQYLPVEEKLRLIGDVITKSHEEDSNHANPIKVRIFSELEIIYAYSNISFTEKQKEDIPKLYDSVLSSGLVQAIIESIPEEEYGYLMYAINETIEAVYKYYNSALGIIESLKNDFASLDNVNVEDMKASLLELAKTPLIQEIMPLIGQE